MKHTTIYAIQRRRSLMLELALFVLAATALTAASAAMEPRPEITRIHAEAIPGLIYY